jgi:hypothetical protein
MSDRLNLEKSILGAIIHCNGYPQVLHILSASNFSSHPTAENRGLYSVIAGLYPDRPIDFITVYYEIKSKYPHDVALMSTLHNVGHEVSSSVNIVNWAFILLQIDITGKFHRQLAEWHAERKANHDHVETGALLEIIENVTAGVDIFYIIDQAILYFQEENMQTELKACIEFYLALSKKVSNIKKMKSIDTALSYVFRITDATPDIVQISQTLATAIATMIISKEIKPEYIQAANLINK